MILDFSLSPFSLGLGLTHKRELLLDAYDAVFETATELASSYLYKTVLEFVCKFLKLITAKEETKTEVAKMASLSVAMSQWEGNKYMRPLFLSSFPSLFVIFP